MISRTALMVSTALAAVAVPGIAAAQDQAAPVAEAPAPDPAVANDTPDSDDASPDVISRHRAKAHSDAYRSAAVDLRDFRLDARGAAR